MSGNVQLTEEQIVKVKTKLTEWGLLDPVFSAEGDPRTKITHSKNWSEQCISASEEFLRLFSFDNADGLINDKDADFILSKSAPSPLKTETIKARKIVRAYVDNGWYVARGNNVFNVLWIRDMNRDWSAKSKTPDAWDDVCVVWQGEHNGTVRIIEEYYQVTTEPGRFYTEKPVNVDGAARIAIPGQYKAWQRGLHGSGERCHQGFRQEAPIRVFRDANKDFCSNDETEDGVFYCNWHSTANSPETIGRWSAGCSVFRFMGEFNRFRNTLESDRRFLANKGYMFIGAYISGDDIAKAMI